MKVIKTAEKSKLLITQSEWRNIGLEKGWIKEANCPCNDDDEDCKCGPGCKCRVDGECKCGDDKDEDQ